MVMETMERPRRQDAAGLEKTLRWLLILLLAAVFVSRFLPDMVQLLSAPPKTIETGTLMIQGFAILLAANALLLLAERTWAFLVLYITILLATLVMGVSLIPWVTGLFRPEQATEVAIGANITVLLIGAWCHWLQKNRNINDRS